MEVEKAVETNMHRVGDAQFILNQPGRGGVLTDKRQSYRGGRMHRH